MTSPSDWWREAQDYEAQSGISWLRRTPKPPSALRQEFFGDDAALWDRFMAHVTSRDVVEVGCGPVAIVQYFPAVVRRIAIDPLIDRYTAAGADFSAACGIDEAISEPAETALPRLAPIAGAIICRNMLDHTEDPMGLFDIMLDAMAPAAWLIFWSDLKHVRADAGHRDVADTPEFAAAAATRLVILRESHGLATPSATSWGFIGVKR